MFDILVQTVEKQIADTFTVNQFETNNVVDNLVKHLFTAHDFL